MKHLNNVGVALLTAGVLLGTSCSSDKTGNAAAGGSASVGGQAGDTGGAGGKGSTSTATTGGKTAGGSTSGGGVTGTGGTPIVPLTSGLSLDGNYLTIDTLKGVIWTTWDTKVAGTPGSTITQVPGKTCVYGTAAKVTCTDAAQTDCAYSTYWGVDLGWNLNQPKDADGGALDPLPADLSAYTSITINFDGVQNPAVPLRIQLTVPDSTGAESYYCIGLPTVQLPATVPLELLKTNCWPGGTPQVKYDAATMKPTSFAIQVYTDVTTAHDYNFCLTQLTFDKP